LLTGFIIEEIQIMYFINGFINIKIVVTMRKKYFLTKLAIFGFLALGTATTFVGCKDYDGDITELQTQIDANKADYTSVLNDKLAAVNSQITALQGTQTALQATVATAQTAASAAKTSSDAAAAAAAAAQLAAAQAKLDAISNAAAALATVKTELTTRISTLDAKFENLKSTTVTKEELAAINTSLLTELANAKSAIDAKIGTVSAQIDAVDSKYNTIVSTLATKNEVEVALQTLKTELAAINLQQSTFTAYQKVVNDQFATLKSEITKINGDVPADSARISALEKKVGTLEATLTTAIATAKSEAIAAAVAADTQMAASLQQMWQNYVNTALDKYVSKETYEADMQALRSDIEEYAAGINAKLNTLNAIFSHRLTSMAFVPEIYSNGIPTIYMFKLNYTELGKTDPLYAYNHPKVKYRMNPSGVTLDDICAFDYTGEKAVNLGARSLGNDPAAPISVAAAESLDGGVLTLKLQRNESIAFANYPQFSVVSLKATLANKALASNEQPGGVAVYSDYVKTAQVPLSCENLNIARNGSLGYHYQPTQGGAQGLPADETFDFDGSLDLKAKVASCYLANDDHIAFDEASYGFTYRFAMAPAYNLESGGVSTNQQDFANITPDGMMTAKVYQNNPLNAAIGRTPIVMVELIDAQCRVVKRAFIKVKITAQKPAALVIKHCETITLSCSDRDFAFNVEDLNTKVYNVLPMSHEQFWNNYNFNEGSVPSPIISKPILKSASNDGGVYSHEVHWMLNDVEFGVIPAEGKLFVAECKCVSKYEDASNLRDVIFRYEITVKRPDISIYGKELTYWTNEGTAFKVNVAVPTSTHDGNPNNCNYKADLKNAFTKDVYGKVILKEKPSCACLKFRVISVSPVGSTGILIDANDNISLNLQSMNQKALDALNAGTLSAVVMPYCDWNGMTQDLGSFTVKFIRPLSISVTTTHCFTDGVSGGSKIIYYGPNHEVDDLIKDWRDETVSDEMSLWNFYGCSYDIDVPDGVRTNLKDINGNLVPTDGYQDGAVPKDVKLDKTVDWRGNRYLTYTNNGTPLTNDYDMFIPVKLNHKWGSISTTLKIHVNKLGTVSSIKRK
jgi:predicted  nucleic acid-binding Zn-ribbon protein